METEQPQRRLPVGAEVQANGGVHFRLWAPKRKQVEVVLLSGPGGGQKPVGHRLEAESRGYFSGLVAEAGAGTTYRYRVDGSEDTYPDPVSRYQPDGPHGASQVVDPSSYEWNDASWRGLPLRGQVIYEMHLGTFTAEGNYEAATRQFKELAELGITTLEVMPVNEFPGRFGWGYDGVDLFAPTHLYGEPDDLRRFVDLAHQAGLAVILDVVYNHFGPRGNYLRAFSDQYFTDKHKNDWGESINFDDAGSAAVREFFIANAGYWVDEYHFDGLRLDATQAILDDSPEHVLAAITRRVREAGGGRHTLVVAENEKQEIQQVESIERGGYAIDAVWNDDFHHSAMVALSGRNEFYYSDYMGRPQELISALKWGYLFQGQWYENQKLNRGTPSVHVDASTYVTFLQNHDQVANSARGLRAQFLTSPGRYRAMTALFLLAPGTPMLFQGQEFAASTPFYYFADHELDLAVMVQKGRHDFLKQFKSIACSETTEHFVEPADPKTFAACKLNFDERDRNRPIYEMHRDLLRLRRTDRVFAAQRADLMHGAVICDEGLLLRFFGPDNDDRLLLVNLGRDHHWSPAPEPLMAPPRGTQWQILWSSENPKYGGNGTPALEHEQHWGVPGHAAVVLKPAIKGQCIVTSSDEAL